MTNSGRSQAKCIKNVNWEIFFLPDLAEKATPGETLKKKTHYVAPCSGSVLRCALFKVFYSKAGRGRNVAVVARGRTNKCAWKRASVPKFKQNFLFYFNGLRGRISGVQND